MNFVFSVTVIVGIFFSAWNTCSAVDPIINNLPNSTSVHEDTATEIYLYTINATDADGDRITCDLGTTSPEFQIKYISGTADWGIYTRATAAFDTSNQSNYVLDVECVANGGTATGQYMITITPDASPVIHNLPDNVTIPVTSAVGTNIFTVIATDVENDQIHFTMTCDPATPPCPFDIFDSGAIQLTAELSTTTVVGYDITVEVSDAGGSGVSRVLTVLFSGINSPPVITNLNTSHSEPENSGLGTTLLTVACSDSDVTDTHLFSMTCSNSGATYFNINSSTGAIKTSSVSAINYEYLLSTVGTSFTCSVTCNDGTDTSVAWLDIDVTDVNEAPRFTQNSYSLSADEGAAGTVLTTGFDATDEDSTDTKFFSLDCGTPNSGYFNINTSTGAITFASDYDVDTGVRPRSLICNVTVTDSGGLSDTNSLFITINNVNDNAPDFPQNAYVWFISQSASVGTTVGTVTATDADIGIYGNITYSLDLSSLADEYFQIDQSGIVRIKTSIASLGTGVTSQFYVLATDGGGNETRVLAQVIITATTTTTTTTTTDRYKTFFEDGRNIAWFAACVVALFITVIVTFLMCFSIGGDSTPVFYRGSNRHKRNWGESHRENFKRPEPPPPPTPPQPPAKLERGPLPSTYFNFWSESYAQMD